MNRWNITTFDGSGMRGAEGDWGRGGQLNYAVPVFFNPSFKLDSFITSQNKNTRIVTTDTYDSNINSDNILYYVEAALQKARIINKDIKIKII